MILLILFIFYLFCISPNITLGPRGSVRHKRMKQFERYYIAHRGLFVKENHFNHSGSETGAETLTCTDSDNVLKSGTQSGSETIMGTGSEKITQTGSEASEPPQSPSGSVIQLIPENSMQAFKRAVESGYGIELDVQLTKDHKLVVFHDKTLKRMCGINKKISACTFEELQAYGLAGTEEKIPLFKDVLNLVKGRVPLIVEIKEHGKWKNNAHSAAKHLDWYMQKYGSGRDQSDPLFCVESFHPGVVAWFRAHRRDFLRGQLSSDYMREKVNNKASSRFIVSNLLLNWAGRPDFIAYNCLYADQFTYKLVRRLFKTEHVAWTVRSQEQLDSLRDLYQVFIFEGFLPKN